MSEPAYIKRQREIHCGKGGLCLDCHNLRLNAKIEALEAVQSQTDGSTTIYIEMEIAKHKANLEE